MRATWNGQVIAESDDTVVVEGNHYFPREAVSSWHVKDSDKVTMCPTKGRASYLTLEVNGAENPDAAWYYPDPTETASEIRDRVAFWRGVKLEA
ncbi:MAG: DUF427 domain-containing protein [Propionibacteriales bacterium]|nr:DUF427 domain-containing protein [Propionibacteriales bacterium]